MRFKLIAVYRKAHLVEPRRRIIDYLQTILGQAVANKAMFTIIPQMTLSRRGSDCHKDDLSYLAKNYVSSARLAISHRSRGTWKEQIGSQMRNQTGGSHHYRMFQEQRKGISKTVYQPLKLKRMKHVQFELNIFNMIVGFNKPWFQRTVASERLSGRFWTKGRLRTC